MGSGNTEPLGSEGEQAPLLADHSTDFVDPQGSRFSVGPVRREMSSDSQVHGYLNAFEA